MPTGLSSVSELNLLQTPQLLLALSLSKQGRAIRIHNRTKYKYQLFSYAGICLHGRGMHINDIMYSSHRNASARIFASNKGQLVAHKATEGLRRNEQIYLVYLHVTI